MLTCRSERGRALALAWVAAAGLAALAPPAAQGLTYTWINALGGASNVGGNWDRGSTPGAGDAVHFGPLSAYTTSFSGGDTYASLAATAGSPTFSVFNTLTFTGGAVVNGGALSLGHPTIPVGVTGLVSAFNWQVGNGAASTLVVSGGHTTAYSADSASGSFLGNLGNATVTLQTGGAFNSNGSIEIGTQAASTCSTYVTGFTAGAFGSASALRTFANPNFSGWVDRGRLVVGAVGHGGLNVDNGAVVSVASDLTLGKFPGSVGIMRLSAKSGATRAPILNVMRATYLGSGFGMGAGGTAVLSVEAGTARLGGNVHLGDASDYIGTPPVRAHLRVFDGGSLVITALYATPGGALELRGGTTQMVGSYGTIQQAGALNVSSNVGTPVLWIEDSGGLQIMDPTPSFGIGGAGIGSVRVAGGGASLYVGVPTVMADSTGGIAHLDADSGAVVTLGRLNMSNSGSATVTVHGNARMQLTSVYGGYGGAPTIRVVGSGSTLNVGDTLVVGTSDLSIPGVVDVDSSGVLNCGSWFQLNSHSDHAHIAHGGALNIFGAGTASGDFQLDGGAIRASQFRIDEGMLHGPGVVRSRLVLLNTSSRLAVTPGDPSHHLLVVGDSTRTDAFESHGYIDIADDTLAILESGGANVGEVTFSGGTLRLPQGGRLAADDTLAGSGRIEGSFVNGGVMSMGAVDVIGFTDTLDTMGGIVAGGTLDVLPGAMLLAGGSRTFNLLLEGSLAPGPTPGRLALTGSASFAPTALLPIRLGSHASNVQDTISVSGAVLLDGTLDLRLVPGYVHTVGDTFIVLRAGSINGTFAAVRFNGSPGAGIVQLVYGATTVKAVIVGAALAVEPGPHPSAAPLTLRLAAIGAPMVSALALDLPTTASVRVELFDVTGRQVLALASGERAAGRYVFPLSAATLPSGVFFARARIADGRGTRVLNARVVRLR